MSSDHVPASAFECLLPKIITVLELTQNSEGMASLEVKKAILQATNDLKDSLNRAIELAEALPGGEITIEEQDQVITMLEETHNKMKQRIDMFSTQASILHSASMGLASSAQSNGTPTHDSAASTPN